MPTVEELLEWHRESRLSEITAAKTMADAFRLCAEVNGLDQDDGALRLVWQIGCAYVAARAIRAMREGVSHSEFTDALVAEMIDGINARLD